MSDVPAPLKDLILRLAQEVITADVSSLKAQQELWQRFHSHPESVFPGATLYEGWADERYLEMREVSFTVHLRPVRQSFWKRLSGAWRLLIGRMRVQDLGGIPWEITPAGAPRSIEVTCGFRKEDKDSVSITYAPQDEQWRQYFEQDPVLRTHLKTDPDPTPQG